MALEPWLREVNDAGVARVAEALDLRVDGWILCTGCGCALESGFSDWQCRRCLIRGDALGYAAQALAGSRADLRRALALRGLCRPAA